jgi:hypothetical protein
LDFLEVDATSQRGGLMWPNIEAWIPKLGFLGGGCDEAGVED